MKKISTLLLLCVSALAGFAQTRTLESVSYRGAFQPGVSMWTNTWTNFDPQNTVYGSGLPVTQVSAAITKNTTWLSTRVYQLNGPIYVKSGATLTIQPGTVILGNANVSNSCLIISKGSRIMAQGTVNSPIVFTSSKAAGTRNVGDWGGVAILGNALYNGTGGSANIEGLAAAPDNSFGGSNDEDNSGVFSYCRIEFGGYIFTVDKEINGLTLGAVGRKTKVDHVQVSFINDDAFEWFGGSVNCSHLVAYRCVDDDFDTDNGFSGTVQFGLAIRDRAISDQSSGSTSEGFESDNEAVGTDSTITPRTNAVFSNITVIGPYRNDLVTATGSSFKFRRAMRIRRNSNLRVFNSVFTDFQQSIFIDGSRCAYNAAMGASNANSLAVKNNVFASMKNGSTNSGLEANSSFGTTVNGVAVPALTTWFTNSGNSYQAASNGLFVDNIAASNFSMDYRPATGSVLESGADFTDAFIEPRTRINLGTFNIVADTLEIATKLSTDNVSISATALTNADSYTWTVPTGVVIVSGQGTTTLVVNFPTAYKPAIGKNMIRCFANNSASATRSNLDSVRVTLTKPVAFRITALRSNSSNGIDRGSWSSTVSSTVAVNATTINVASTSGLEVGMIIKLIAGTGAGAISTSARVASIVSATQFTVSVGPTTAIVANAVLAGFKVAQNTTANYVSAAGATNVGTLVTVASTTGLAEGMTVAVTSGDGAFKAGTVVTKVVNATEFLVSLAPAIGFNLSNSAVVTAYPLWTNTCDITPTSGVSAEYDYSVVATTVNAVGYRFDVPKNATISRVGNNSIPVSDSTKFVFTTATSIGVVFNPSFISGSIKATPYNNAGTGLAFSVSVKRSIPLIYKVISSGVVDTTGAPVTFTASLTNGSTASSYVWTLDSNYMVNSGSVSLVGKTKVVTTTSNTISLSFKSSFKAGTITVRASGLCGLGTPKTFKIAKNVALTKNSNGVELTEEGTEEEMNNENFTVYPNPNNGTFNVSMISSNTTDNAVVEIVNMMGQVVASYSVANNEGNISTEINNNDLMTGFYFVKVSVGAESKITKISVQK
jgi:hypothetical protein